MNECTTTYSRAIKKNLCSCGSLKGIKARTCWNCRHASMMALRRPSDPNIYFVYSERLGIVELCRKLPLTKGQSVLISDLDYQWSSQRNWLAWWNLKTQSFYAERALKCSGSFRIVMLHREIYEHAFGELAANQLPDHRNKESLDCRRSNLRIASQSQNMCNSGKRRNNTSGYKGVTWHSQNKKWMAQIKIKGKHLYLGIFGTKEEAYSAYCKAALELHGEFAQLE